jgi:iron-sulfur-dependent L-serine dehydratase single chain form
MFLSVFDIFKIGIGPSSSHTMGPMTAAAQFLEMLRSGLREPGAGDVARVMCSLHGSLAFTGKGHATDRAVILGLLGFLARTWHNPTHTANDWMSVYAMAVNEENAAGGKVVTSPTNGAAGVVPAVMRYYRDHCIGSSDEGLRTFLLTAAAIGGLIKHNASISGAEVGCQGEVGSAAAMAAAGLCAALGGTNEQIENAAEIALEHHLGMSCDPVGGLVQVPCIERNGLGAIKAVSAASLALHGDGQHFMPLDNCIEAMRQTGVDMSEKYKETSLGGLAVNLPEC